MGLSSSRDLAQLGKRLGLTGPNGAITGPQAKMGEMEHLHRVNDKHLASDRPGPMPRPQTLFGGGGDVSQLASRLIQPSLDGQQAPVQHPSMFSPATQQPLSFGGRGAAPFAGGFQGMPGGPIGFQGAQQPQYQMPNIDPELLRRLLGRGF